jgi:hypothetical protein
MNLAPFKRLLLYLSRQISIAFRYESQHFGKAWRVGKSDLGITARSGKNIVILQQVAEQISILFGQFAR